MKFNELGAQLSSRHFSSTRGPSLNAQGWKKPSSVAFPTHRGFPFSRLNIPRILMNSLPEIISVASRHIYHLKYIRSWASQVNMMPRTDWKPCVGRRHCLPCLDLVFLLMSLQNAHSWVTESGWLYINLGKMIPQECCWWIMSLFCSCFSWPLVICNSDHFVIENNYNQKASMFQLYFNFKNQQRTWELSKVAHAGSGTPETEVEGGDLA